MTCSTKLLSVKQHRRSTHSTTYEQVFSWYAIEDRYLKSIAKWVETIECVASREMCKCSRTIANGMDEEIELIALVVDKIDRNWAAQKCVGRALNGNVDKLPWQHLGDKLVII